MLVASQHTLRWAEEQARPRRCRVPCGRDTRMQLGSVAAALGNACKYVLICYLVGSSRVTQRGARNLSNRRLVSRFAGVGRCQSVIESLSWLSRTLRGLPRTLLVPSGSQTCLAAPIRGAKAALKRRHARPELIVR